MHHVAGKHIDTQAAQQIETKSIMPLFAFHSPQYTHNISEQTQPRDWEIEHYLYCIAFVQESPLK
jgi:hypothetical protein